MQYSFLFLCNLGYKYFLAYPWYDEKRKEHKPMIGYHGAIEELTNNNTYFRQVLFTAPHSQLVLMCLAPSEEIGMEVHPDNDQFFRFESGEGKVIIDGTEYLVKDGDVAIVPAGNMHNVVNTGLEDLKLYTIYSPPNHPDGTIHKTKAEALAAEKEEHA